MTYEQHEQGGRAGGSWQDPASASGATQGGPAAGWYPDPWDRHRRRYWDGGWTGDVSYEPPGNWAGGAQQGGHTQQQPRAEGGWAAGAPAAQLPGGAAHDRWSPVGHRPAEAGWAAGAWGAPQAYEGAWGQPPRGPGGAWGLPGWQPAPARRPAGAGSRIHVGIVAVIAAIAVLAGIGVGSQINSSSSASANGATGGGGATSPFGGGATGGLGGLGGRGATGGTGSTTLTPAQQALATRVDRSVVDINTELGYQQGAAAGTGMVLTPDGTVLTNNHVIDGATSISVTVVSTGKTYKADVVGDDVTQDVAVIKMEGASGLTPIDLGTGASVGRGDQVVALGNAGGAGGTPSAVSGTVTDLNQTITASDQNGANAEMLNGLIETDAPIQAGDSGGPLVNAKGQVIGMDTAASSGNAVQGTGSVGFAIPITQATTIATQITQGHGTDKVHIGATGFLGVSVQASTGSGLPGSLGTGNGASVQSVIPGSPADKAGIAGGDTITQIDGTAISSSTALTKVLRAHHPGDSVQVGWTDASGAAHSAAITLTQGPAA